MNITGYGQYSKGTAGVRNPKRNINSQLKLIFIYPILIADKIKVQSTPPFEQLIRDFISVTFLSDLFIMLMLLTLEFFNKRLLRKQQLFNSLLKQIQN